MKFILAFIILNISISSFADSKRVEVYPGSQIYIDVKHGDTLGEIVTAATPHSRAMRKQLMQDILTLNPGAFIDNDPNKLKADVRLWLPDYMTGLNTDIDRSKYKITETSWGYIKQLK